MILAVRVKVGLDKFWDITPFELEIHNEAYQRDIDFDMRTFSFFTSALLNAWSKKRIKPTDLYKPRINNSNNKREKSFNLKGAPASVIKAHFAKKRERASITG